MATVNGLTAERMLEIEAASVVDGDVVGGNLILTQHDGTQIDAGSVVGPAGPQGPVGADLAVLAAKPVLDVGLANQIRAGRQLGPADFNALGLSAPLGLWNLSDLSDVSGNGRNLLNKGAVPFASGIVGAAASAAQFTGAPAQALYIADTGANDPFRIKAGSFGCWFRNAKTGLQTIMSKWRDPPPGYGWSMRLNTRLELIVSQDGTNYLVAQGSANIADDRWHFAVVTFDAIMIRLYIDGLLDNQTPFNFPLFGSPGAFNIGGRGADAATNATEPFFGRIDEAFISGDILTDDQVRNLYCAKLAHALGVIPSRVSLNIRRRRRGAALIAGDFPTQPLRLHNFSAGSLADEGSGNVVLINNGAAIPIAGADGGLDNAFNFNGAQSLSSTDAGLPAALTARSAGCWFKTATANGTLVSWGTLVTGDLRLDVFSSVLRMLSGGNAVNGPFVVDGLWHFAVVVEDNTALDGVKRKLYLDGRLVATDLNMSAIALLGANRFRVGAASDGSALYTGQIDTPFVCGYALTPEQIYALYAKGSQTLAPSPKNVGDHIEAMSSTDLLVAFDMLESVHQVDLKVAA